MPAPGSTTESLTADELRALLREAEQALSNATGETSEQFSDLIERLRAAVGEGRDTLERLREQAMRQAKHADQLVRENPYMAIGVAAGVGALIGILVARGCRD